MFSTADFVDSIVGHADPWKQRWFLSRFSTSNSTFDDMPQGVSGAIKKRGGSNRFANLDVSEADEIGWRFPDVRFQAIGNSRRLDGALRGKARVTHSRRSKLW